MLQEPPTGTPSAVPAQRSTPYREALSRLRAECEECAEGTSRPEHVGQLSWHEWGHLLDGAPTESRCTCGTKLRSGPRLWHCGGCHETFSGEDAFMRHRRGPGDARYCLEPRSTGRERDWWTAQGVWHYGPRRDVRGPSEASTPTVVPVAA
ncbi:hypothetical protein [Brachybacterium massiliense]|uniref:FDXHR family putative zinc-binding protein n=1 Tax=Brachybacterium massiliense TaxID=1755098 RepID=UPI003CCBE174